MAEGQPEARLVRLSFLPARRLVDHEVAARRLYHALEPLDRFLDRGHVVVRVAVAHVDAAREQPTRHVPRDPIALGVVGAGIQTSDVDHLSLLCAYE